MKNKVKFLMLNILVALALFSSCSNDDETTITEPQNEKTAITTALEVLSNHLTDTGALEPTTNPTNNMVMDFGFNFVYPITLSAEINTDISGHIFSRSSSASNQYVINSFQELSELLTTIAENLTITGIAFPFDVEVFNSSTNSIEVLSITNEQAFVDFLENLDFYAPTICECFEDFNPVAVNITAPDGNTFSVVYPNACYAACDGFSETDFVDIPDNNYFNPVINCFEFNYPINIIIDNTNIIINSNEDFTNTIYGSYNFDFVLPLSITLNNDTNDVITITTLSDFQDILANCYNDGGGNVTDPGDCIEGEDPVTTTNVSVSNFTEIRLLVNADVTINQGAYNLSYNTQQNITDYLVNDVIDNVLEIKFEDGCYLNYDLEITITLPNLNAVQVTSNANVTINNFSGQDDSLDVFQQGNGTITLNEFEGISSFNAQIQGNGNFVANNDISSVQNVIINQQGISNYSGFSISSPNVTVVSQGNNISELTATSTLDITLQGSGTIYYKGNPNITQNITGTGSIVDAN